MFSDDRILTLDIGASKILLSEFSVKGSAAPVLTNYVSAPRDPFGADSGMVSMADFADVVTGLMVEKGIKPAPLYVMLSGQMVFPRFVKFPGSASDLSDDMVAAEAAEGLPFPLDQVVWDYQTLGTNFESGELEALIVATKSDTALDAATLSENAGLPLELVEAAPVALYNSVRFNCADMDGCSLVLDIGAKTTNLVFVEGDKFFTRTIPVAGNTITNEIARGLGIEPAEAEALKKSVGFVALGGTYAVVDDETADRISKIIRNVATRLHSEVNRSINFYRSQQGGSAPVRVLLTGGTALLRHLDTFFQEKLGVEVSFFNPFTAISVDPSLQEDTENLFLMASSTGLALRRAIKCPVEINLTPAAIVAARRFRRRIPFFAVSVVGVVLTLLCWITYANGLQKSYAKNQASVSHKLKELKGLQSQLESVGSEVDEATATENYLAQFAASRFSYARLLEAVRQCMLKDTWMTSLTFQNPDFATTPVSDEMGESSAPAAAGHAILVVSGFKPELDNLKEPASETFLKKLKETEFFKDGTIVYSKAISKNRITEIKLDLELARPLGRVDASWLPAVQPKAESEEEAVAEEEASL